jgi:acyl-CoA synthetase (AMP-forming)/AMP-acid ligase II
MRTMLDVFRDAAARAPGTEVFGATMADLDAASDAFAAALLDRGFLFGDKLAIAVPDGPNLLIAVVGAWKAGGSVVLADPAASTGELVDQLAESHATALYADGEHDAVVAHTDVHIVIAGADHLRDLLALHAGERPLASTPDQDAIAIDTTTQGAMASAASAASARREDRIGRLALALTAPEHEGDKR